MFKDYYHKNVKVTTKSGHTITGYFSDAYSEQDNEGPATIEIGRWSIEEQDVDTIELIKDIKEESTQK